MAIVGNVPHNPLIPTETGGPPVPAPSPLPDLPDGFADALERRFGPGDFSTDLRPETPPPSEDNLTPIPASVPVPATPATSDEAPADDRTGGADDGTGEGASPPAPSPAPDTFRVTVDGQEVELTQQQLTQMMALTSWAQGIAQNPELAQQIAALEYGQAVAVSRDEYLRLMQANTQQPTPAAPPANRPDLTYADPEVAAYVAQLEAQRAAAPAPAYPGQDPAVAYQQLIAQQQEALRQQQIQQASRVIDAAANDFAQQTGLTADQLDQVHEHAVRLGAFGHFAQESRVVSPTGQLLKEPDMAEVTAKALRLAALDLNYTLQQQPTAPTPGTTAPQPPVQVQSTQMRDDVVANKKAAAASLATSNGGAMPTPTRDPRGAQPMEMAGDIANFLREQGVGQF